ncbi:MAG: hypothetical protein Q8K86_01560 [Candidatus Nanopelagicaceae bacterium]|nr:hypothetical protein [Candidatus Nanopelagicaceae bacterium]
MSKIVPKINIDPVVRQDGIIKGRRLVAKFKTPMFDIIRNQELIEFMADPERCTAVVLETMIGAAKKKFGRKFKKRKFINELMEGLDETLYDLGLPAETFRRLGLPEKSVTDIIDVSDIISANAAKDMQEDLDKEILGELIKKFSGKGRKR